MSDQDSRYFQLDNLTYVNEDGYEVKYKSRRILPQSSAIPSLVQVQVERGQRLDQISASTLGNPEFYWKLGDGNNAFSLVDLEKPKTVLRIPVIGMDT